MIMDLTDGSRVQWPTGEVPSSIVRSMKVKYFQDTDTLFIELNPGEVVETKDLDENTQIDVDRGGDICAITIEHAKTRADLPHFSFEQVGS